MGKRNRESNNGLCMDNNGLAWEYINSSDSDFIYDEIFVRECYIKHGIKLYEDSIIFDVGANIGLFSLFCLQKLDNIKLYCFEPIPPIFNVLQRNLINTKRKTSLFNTGIGSVNNIEKFYYFMDCPGESTTKLHERENQRKRLQHEIMNSEVISSLTPTQHKIEEVLETNNQTYDSALSRNENDKIIRDEVGVEYLCQVKTLGSIIRELELPRIDLIKIDIEGNELEALQGIDTATWLIIQQVVIEVHDIEGRLATVMSLLVTHGFEAVCELQLPELYDHMHIVRHMSMIHLPAAILRKFQKLYDFGTNRNFPLFQEMSEKVDHPSCEDV